METNLLSISQNYEVFLIDLFGTIWNGKNFFPLALRKLEMLMTQGKTVIILSNYPQRSPQVAEIYKKYGLLAGEHYHRLVTSGDLAYQIFSHDSQKLKYSVIGRRDNGLFADSKYTFVPQHSAADVVYLGNPLIMYRGNYVEAYTLAAFENELKQVLDLQKPCICANPDRKSHIAGDSHMVLRAGSFAEYIERHGGTVTYFGKPDKRVFKLALHDIDVPQDQILMVGDALETDILGGINAGVHTALVNTGVSHFDMRQSSSRSINEYMRQKGIIADHVLNTF